MYSRYSENHWHTTDRLVLKLLDMCKFYKISLSASRHSFIDKYVAFGGKKQGSRVSKVGQRKEGEDVLAFFGLKQCSPPKILKICTLLPLISISKNNP